MTKICGHCGHYKEGGCEKGYKRDYEKTVYIDDKGHEWPSSQVLNRNIVKVTKKKEKTDVEYTTPACKKDYIDKEVK